MEKKLHFTFEVQQSVLQKIAFIDSFKSRWQIEKASEKVALKELQFLATVESTGSSTRIEGATLTDKEVELLLNNIKITQLKSREEQEVAGYYEVLQTIYENYEGIPLTENHIRQLHKMLLRHSMKDQRHRGEYKTLNNQVVATSPEGTQKVIFQTTLPHLTPKEMGILVEWTYLGFEEKKLHPLIIIPTFVYEFLSIHPFQDGNGRLSRLLTTLLLLQHGYDFVQYISFENYIEKKKKEYYSALMEGQKRRYQKDENIQQWMLFFLSGMEALIYRLEEKRKQFELLNNYLNERQQQLLAIISEKQLVQISILKPLFPKISLATLKNDLKLLVNQRKIVKVGKGRGVKYIVK